jgi:hypothetical protein
VDLQLTTPVFVELDSFGDEEAPLFLGTPTFTSKTNCPFTVDDSLPGDIGVGW